MTPSLAPFYPAQNASLVAPLWGVAVHARLWMAAGLLIAALGGLAMAVLGGVVAMATAMAGGSVALLAAVSGVVAGRRARQTDQEAKGLALALVNDPDPIILTDAQGLPRATNAAAGDCPDPVHRLSDWCVDPGDQVLAILSQVQRTGHYDREFLRRNKSLRVMAHRTGGTGLTTVWRFSTTDRQSLRTVSALGVPILTLDDGVITANPAAQEYGDADSYAPLAQDTDLSDPGEGAQVSLPTGQAAMAHRVPARDGLTDIILVPPQRGVRGVAGPHGPDFEDLPVAMVQLDPGGKIVGTNRLARGLLTLKDDENRYFWQVVEGLGRPVADWLDDARDGRALGRPEVLRATLTGAETYVQIILRRLAGRPGLVAVISDATELKSLEARFVQSQKMQAIGQLAGGVAHDFNNLLTAISGHCDLLLINRDRFDPDYNDLLQIHQNANRAAALVRQLLAFSRKQTMKPETLRLESLLEDLTHLLTRLVGERITLDLIHDPALCAIRADRRQLEQVIMNLVVNARDAMPMGGTIRLETEARHLATEVEIGRVRIPPGHYTLIRVMDEGVGIPADIIDKIFEPFFTTKRLGEGTGLGLSTAYGIVKQMGGYIFAHSVEGSGTVFTLYFASLPQDGLAAPSKPSGRAATPSSALPPAVATPVSVAEGPTATPRPPAERLAGLAPTRGGTILLVEDEAPVRAFAARALRLLGYQVFEAQDGEQALEFLSDTALHIDLFVTDVIMPGIDGPGWVTQALAHRPNTPVVFVSGYTEDTLSEALSRIPRSVFLGKPFSLQDLSGAIDAQLRA